MKIAYVYDAIYPYIKGGAEKRIYELSKRLVAGGHEVHWFGVKWWKGKDVILQDGIYLHGVCKVESLYTEEGGRSIKEALIFGYKLLPSLVKEDFDIIDAGNFPYFSCFSSKIASLLKGKPLVITWHEVWGSYWYEYLGAKGFFGKFVEKISTKLPHKHVAVSECTKRGLLALGVDEKKIEVIPNGIDFDAIQKIPPSKKKCDVLFAGRLIREKNVDALIRAVSEIKKSMPIKCRIIGEGPEKEKLRALSKNLGLQTNVEFLDFMPNYEDLIANMKSSELFVLPSSREGFSIVLLEAMASQTPVIAVESEKSAASEIINGKNGILCSMGELKEKIEEVLTSETLRSSLIKEGWGYSKSLNWNIIAEKILKFYENMLATPKAKIK